MTRQWLLDVYGRQLIIDAHEGGWRIMQRTNDGKRGPFFDICIPSSLSFEDIPRFLADIYHEDATPGRPDVIVLQCTE